MDLAGPNGIVQLRFTHDAESYYENEEENISEQIETYYQGGEGENWKIPAQIAADCWDWDDEAVINFNAESELVETTRDFDKMEFLNKEGEWERVPTEVEEWFFEAEEKSMEG